jgi:hypothetical protein
VYLSYRERAGTSVYTIKMGKYKGKSLQYTQLEGGGSAVYISRRERVFYIHN